MGRRSPGWRGGWSGWSVGADRGKHVHQACADQRIPTAGRMMGGGLDALHHLTSRPRRESGADQRRQASDHRRGITGTRQRSRTLLSINSVS